MRILISDKIYIPKKYVTKDFLRWIKKELRLDNPEYESNKRYGYGEGYSIEPYLYLYSWKNDRLILPRGFYYKIFRYCKRNRIKLLARNKTIVRASGLSFDPIPLHNFQEQAADNLERLRQGIIALPCGTGKTRTGIELIRRIENTTLIIVNSLFLVDQWTEYIKELLNYSPGIIQGDNFKLKKITIATVQTLSKRNLDSKFFNRWGLVFVDETHHIPADTYQDLISNFKAQYRYGVTATVNRSDGLTKMIYYTMGNVGFSKTAKELDKEGYISIPDVNIIHTDFSTRRSKYTSVIDSLIADNRRNTSIINRLYENRERYNLVLSSRIQHLETLASLYALHSSDYKVITGKVSNKKREEIVSDMKDGRLHVIFATQLADEGLDIPNLDTLHLVHPTKSQGRIEQRIGRTQRVEEGKNKPIVYDYFDNYVPMLASMANKRMRLYNHLELRIRGVNDNIVRIATPDINTQLGFNI